MDYVEVCHKGYCFVFCDMQNVYKIRIVKVMKGWWLSRDGTSRSWKAFQLYALKGKDLKIFCKRNVLKMTRLWSSSESRVRGTDFTTVLSAGLREEWVWAWVLLQLCRPWAESCPPVEGSRSLTLWLGWKSHRSEWESLGVPVVCMSFLLFSWTARQVDEGRTGLLQKPYRP